MMRELWVTMGMCVLCCTMCSLGLSMCDKCPLIYCFDCFDMHKCHK